MSIFQINRRFFETPHPATYFLLTANIVIYAFCVSQSGRVDIPPAMLFRNGAMYTQALEQHQYWRLVAAGFLHANLLHIGTNMLCLALWGGHLEARIGSAYFVLVYFGALIAGGLVSNMAHATPYVSVGASGAISGLLGALLCLRLLGKIDLPASFFAINIGLNVALAFTARNLDWGAHLGGFVAGIIIVAVLDVIEKANDYALRCKFPEFAKMNLLLLMAGALVLVLAQSGGVAGAWTLTLICCLAGLVVVKLIDIALARRKGLAITVIGFAVANAAFVFLAVAMLAPAACSLLLPAANVRMRGAVLAGCGNAIAVLLIATALTLVLTLLLYSQELQRGLKDIGFAGTAMTGERKRRFGL
jgi:membrane associated rhomboid family serine protease